MKGRITYCNPAFVEVSGFSTEELLGQPHNIVRHPDMPEEAFRDMWHTIQGGLPWSGMVKNRRKNGDHYWVQANATPMRDGQRIVGFLSVRTQPSRDAVAAAEALYARMRDEAAQGRKVHGLRRGAVVRLDALGRLRAALTPGLRGQLFALQLMGVAAVVAAGGVRAVVGCGAGRGGGCVGGHRSDHGAGGATLRAAGGRRQSPGLRRPGACRAHRRLKACSGRCSAR